MGRYDYMKLEPKRIDIDVTFRVDGGDIRDEKLDAVVSATMRAFLIACKENGLDSSHVLSLRSMSPAQFTAMKQRRYPPRSRDEAHDEAISNA